MPMNFPYSFYKTRLGWLSVPCANDFCWLLSKKEHREQNLVNTVAARKQREESLVFGYKVMKFGSTNPIVYDEILYSSKRPSSIPYRAFESIDRFQVSHITIIKENDENHLEF